MLAVVLAAAGIYTAAGRIRTLLAGTGCQAGSGRTAVSLDPQQAAIAATIAGVAYHQVMPSRAVTIAYAAAMQESHLHDLKYGDRDSVGVFQQRPSEGWGPARKLRDPVYASGKFFRALAAIHGYQRLPVYRAAQAVQRSADGYAYAQYQRLAAKLTAAFTGRHPHAVWCWSGTATTGAADLAAAQAALVKTFGRLGPGRRSTPDDAPSMLVWTGRPALGWTVAAWLVTHASSYRLHTVRYAGYQWRAAAGTAGWTREKEAGPAGDVMAS